MSPHVTDFVHLKTPRLSMVQSEGTESYEAQPTVSSRHPNAFDDGLNAIEAVDMVGVGPKSGCDGIGKDTEQEDESHDQEALTITSLKSIIVALSLKLKARE